MSVLKFILTIGACAIGAWILLILIIALVLEILIWI